MSKNFLMLLKNNDQDDQCYGSPTRCQSQGCEQRCGHKQDVVPAERSVPFVDKAPDNTAERVWNSLSCTK